MKQVLNLKQSQKLTLSSHQQQSLKLLQATAQNLNREIDLALECNPLLERDETAPPTPEAEANSQIDVASDNRLLGDRENDEIDIQQKLASARLPTNNRKNLPENKEEYSPQQQPPQTLFEYLHWQITMTGLSDRDRMIGDYILYSLNDEGYLTISLQDLAKLFEPELDVEINEISAVLSLIKTLDPIGIGARDLQERLLLQLEHFPPNTPALAAAKTIVVDHLKLIASNNTARIKSITNLGQAVITDAIKLISKLNPRVTNQFKEVVQDQIIPDLLVTQINNEWVVSLNKEHVKSLRINQTYARLLESDIIAKDKEFIQTRLTQARQFISGLKNRHQTLLMVGQAIVAAQRAYFEKGESYMAPLTLQEIARKLDLHESTISRATAGKYCLSNRGVSELKFFFSNGVSNEHGDTASATAIRSLVKKIIYDESKQKPLSDNKIGSELEKMGHKIARRTVTKYRESMSIAPSHLRKTKT